MIVVKLEIWPGGNENRAREIGRTYIANVGGSEDRGEYVAAVCRRGRAPVPREIYEAAAKDPSLTQEQVAALFDAEISAPRAIRTGAVSDYPRLSYNVWRLIIRALRSCFPEES